MSRSLKPSAPSLAHDEKTESTSPILASAPPVIPIAATAAAEHLTATLAERVLANKEYIDGVARDQEIKGVLNWHAFEELEHKAVAFDVFREVAKGSEVTRISVGVVMLALGIPISALGMAFSMAFDPYARRRPVHALIRSIAILSVSCTTSRWDTSRGAKPRRFTGSLSSTAGWTWPRP